MAVRIRVSNSKVNTFRRCKKKYEYRYVMGLRPKKRERPLELGSWVHKLLETHYDGEDWKATHKLLTKQFYGLFEEEREMLGDVPETARAIMKAYLRRYAEEDKQYRVVDSEMNEFVTLPNGIQLQIVVDLIVEDRRGRLWPWDHKVRTKFGDGDSMLIDPQLSLYFQGLKMLGYKNIAGVVYNELAAKPPREPNLLASRKRLEKRQDIHTDVYTYMRAIRRHGFDPSDYADILRRLAVTQRGKFFRRTVLPKDAPQLRTVMGELVMTAGDILRAERRVEFPRTFIPRQCKWDCAYKELCIAQMHGSNIDTMVKTGFTTSDRLRRGEEEVIRGTSEE